MTAALSLPVPSELPAADNRALVKIGDGRFIRRTGGWVAANGTRISLDVAARLVARQLVRVDHTSRHPQLALTGAGRDVRGIILMRKRT
jgi:hypothetical protein